MLDSESPANRELPGRGRRDRVGYGRAVSGCLLACLTLLLASPARADSFVRRLAERALERGIAQETRGDIAQALSSYDEAVRTDTTLGAAALRLGSLRERLGQPDEAELLYSQAVALPETAAEAYAARAQLRDRARRRPEATADLAESVALLPRPDRLQLLGNWYVAARAWPAALNVYRALLMSARERGDPVFLRETQLTLDALSWLAGDTDPVLAGWGADDWVRRSLSRLARPRKRAVQGARKLTP